MAHMLVHRGLGNKRLVENTIQAFSYCFKKKYGIKDPLSGFKVYKYSKIAEEVKKISSNFYLSEVVMIFKKKKGIF